MTVKTQNERTGGTTLIELILYLAITTGIMIGVGTIGLSVLEQRNKAQVIDDVRYYADVINAAITMDVREGSSILFPLYPNSASTTLTVSSLDTSKNPIVYTVDDGILYRSEGADERQPLNPAHVPLREHAFVNIGATGTPSTVQLSGRLVAGENSLGTSYRFETHLTVTATVRAPQL